MYKCKVLLLIVQRNNFSKIVGLKWTYKGLTLLVRMKVIAITD